MATQKDVAKLANVSFITVSRVINNMGNVKPETRERVDAAIKELNYYPNSIAQGLNKNRVFTLAIETPLPVDQEIENNSYYIRLLTGIERYCIKNHYDILLSTSRGRIEEFDCLKPYYSRKADGVIILGAKPTKDQLLRIKKDKIPCVIIGDRDPSSKVNYVDSKNFEGMYDATKILINNGHTKIGFIKGNVDTQNSTDRYKGYCSAMEEFNLLIDKDWLFNGDYSKESGHRVIGTLLKLQNPPTAVVSSTDLMAIGMYEECKKKSLTIPDDISIIGFDGHELCNYMYPPLSTMRQPLEDMGSDAAKILIEQIEDINIDIRHLIFPIEYQQGSSVKKLN